MPASARASRTALAAISMADDPGKPSEGVEPDTDDRDVVHGSALLDRAEGVGQDLGAVLVGREGHHGQLHRHADAQLLVDVAREPRLDPALGQLDEADAVRHEVRWPVRAPGTAGSWAGSAGGSTSTACPSATSVVGVTASPPQLGQASWAGKVTNEQVSQREARSRGSSDGHSNRPSATLRCAMAAPPFHLDVEVRVIGVSGAHTAAAVDV